MFNRLRQKQTIVYSVVFGILITLVVGATYLLVWRMIISHEKENLLLQIEHEAEEYTLSGELPVSADELKTGRFLAYMTGADGQTAVVDQLSSVPVGKALLRHKDNWPIEKENDSLMIRFKEGGVRYRYLAAAGPVIKDGEQIATLYMFKDMEFYYEAAVDSLRLLAAVGTLLFAAAIGLGYWLSGRTIRPIQESYERQKQFTSDASHEMRTPLAVLRLAIQLMKGEPSCIGSATVRQTLDMMEDEVLHLTGLIEKLLEIFRREEGRQPLVYEEIDLSRLCREIMAPARLLAQEKGIVIEESLPESAVCKADGKALGQALRILMDNALKYTPEGGTVRIEVRRDGKHWCLAVADTGIGIADADKSKVFERFYRVDAARSREQGGFGLGLSLAKLIVTLHGGEIHIKDQKPQGTIFEIQIPNKK